MTQVSFSPGEYYWQYLESYGICWSAETKSEFANILERTCWDSPEDASDCNNVAVIALIEAEQSELPMRGLYLETTLEKLGSHAIENPLCAAHLALLHSLIGNTGFAIELAFSAFIQTLQRWDTADESLPVGLIYLPKTRSQSNRLSLEKILQAETGTTQAILLLSEVLQRSQSIFYNATGIRFLNLSAQVLPEAHLTHFQLGIAYLINNQWEGLFALHRARQLAPDHPLVLQALFLAYRSLGQTETANFWLETAQQLHPQPNSLDWQWTKLAVDSSITYVPFEENLLAIEANFRSIVTGVLIAQGDWFEQEMEFWRNRIQPGMTVIDVGANVGVYTFSAARQVGTEGRVIAVEPFSGCVRCLEETCRMNHLPQVRIRAGAASDRSGQAKLALQAASELNEVITGDVEGLENFEEVECFTLDSLIESENLSCVDFLKIDAEGHEMQILAGSDRILAEFKPVILYENIAGNKGSNLPVAEYLTSKGYRLFRYQPYVQQLIEIESVEGLQGNLNIIALPADAS